MDKWSKIKSKIFKEKLNELNNSLRNKSFNEWINKQITEESCFKFNLTEYKTVRNCNKEALPEVYANILEAKEEGLKLEVTAELIEESNFPLHLFFEWFIAHENLSFDQFNEELGDFWGDVWKHAAGGAGVGALAGGTVGGLGTGGLGTFAGTGLGALAGGAAGGLYGAGKNLLKRVWQYKKDQANFDATKDQVLSLLHNLKDYAKKFDLGPKFKAAIDSFVQELGTTKAYKVNTPNPPKTAVEPPKPQEPATAEPQNATSEPNAQSSPPPLPNAQSSPPPLPTPEEIMKPKRQRKKKEQTPTSSTSSTSSSEEKPKDLHFNSADDISKFYDEAQKKAATNDPSDLLRLGFAVLVSGGVDGDYNIDLNVLNKYVNQSVAKDTNKYGNEEKKMAVDAAGAYVSHLEKQKAGIEPKGTEEIKDVGKPVEEELKDDKELKAMSNKDFKEYAKSMGLDINRAGHPGSAERIEAIEALKWHIENKEQLEYFIQRYLKKEPTLKEQVQIYKQLLRR